MLWLLGQLARVVPPLRQVEHGHYCVLLLPLKLDNGRLFAIHVARGICPHRRLLNFVKLTFKNFRGRVSDLLI